ncbi:CD99 molecule isoform 3-T3 [Aulostomus maculatus]
MKSALRTLLLLSLLIGTFCQDEFDLFDALDPAPTPEKPKEIPKAPEPPKNDDPAKPKKPTSGDSDGFGLDLEDALGPELKPKPDTPVVPPSGGGGGGGTFDDSDLFDVNDGSYKPEGGKTGGGGAGDYDSHGGADQPQDPDVPWGQILKMLNANMPEEFYIWMSNIKQMFLPLLERAMDLLQAMPGN